MPQLHVSHALLETGWQRDVLVTIDGRTITAVAPDTQPPTGAERLAGIAVPGVANVHSHAFQRAMAGLVERRGPEDDSFWTWREVMYRFLAHMTPDDVEAVAAWLHVEMLEAGFTASGEFHYLHNDPAGARYADPAEMGARIAAAAQASGIGLALLPCFYAHGGCGGREPKPGQARFLSDLDSFQRLMRIECPARGRSTGRGARHRSAFAARGRCGRAARIGAAVAGGTDPHPRRRADRRGRGMHRLVRRGPGAVAARQHGNR